jgi:hypothetical protein
MFSQHSRLDQRSHAHTSYLPQYLKQEEEGHRGKARTYFLTRLPKCGQARAHGAQAVGQAIPVWQQTDILDICTRAIALASSIQDWRAAHGHKLRNPAGKARFNYAMSKLHDYSLVEVRAGSYSPHTCVHYWTLEFLSRSFDGGLCQLAVRCIGRSVQWETEAEYRVGNRRLLQHAQGLEHTRIKDSIDWSNIEIAGLHCIAHLMQPV